MRIRATGLKAHDINLDLGERTLLAGPCGTGKSSVLDAIRWLLLGHVPAYGKRLRDTAALMRRREMAAPLTLDDGRTVTRELRRTKGDSLTQSVRCSWLPDGSTSDEHEAAALALVGGDAERAAELLDVRQLLADTGPRRTASLQRLLAAGEMDVKERLQIVAEQTVRRLTGTEDRGDLTLSVVLPLVPGSGQDGAPCTGVRAALKATLAADEARLRALDEAIGAARSRLADAERINAAIAEAIGRREAASAACWDAREALRKAEEASGDHVTVSMRSRTAALAERLTSIQIGEADYSEADQLAAKAAETRERADAIAVPERPSALAAERAADALAAAGLALERAESNPWCGIVAGARSIEAALTSVPRVPARLADHVRPILAEMVETASAQGWGDEAALRQAIEDARQLAAETSAAYEAARKAYDEALAEVATLRREAATLDQQATVRRREITEAHAAATAAARKLKAELETERAALVAQLAEQEKALREASAAKEHAEQAHAEAQVRVVELGVPVAAAPIDTDERDQLAADIRTRRAQASTRAELSTLARDLERLGAEREVYAAIEWACARCQEIEVDRAGGVLRDPMRAFLAAAGRREVPFVEASGGDTRIGWVRPDGSTVPVSALCGGEWPVFVAALTSAMLGIVGAELPLLLLEAGETDDVHLGQILGGIASADDVVAVVAVQRHVTAVPKWLVVDTERSQAVAA